MLSFGLAREDLGYDDAGEFLWVVFEVVVPGIGDRPDVRCIG